MNGTIGKTLIIRFSSVGDIVLSSPLVRLLRRRFPAAVIDYLVKSEFSDLVRHSPHCSGILEFPREGGLRDLLALRRRIAARRYDLIVDLHGSIRSRIVCAGARRVVRIRKRKIARFLLVRFKRDVYAWFGGSPPVALRYLETVRAYGIEDDGEGLELAVPPGTGERAELLAAEAGLPPGVPVIGVCPSARHATKIWPADRFAAVAAELASAYDAPVVLFGSEEETGRCASVARAVMTTRPRTAVSNLAGRLSLPETAALMDRCLIVLTNDSGLMHVAAARKRPVVALFGSTVCQLGFFPWGTPGAVVEHPALRCRPCTHIGRSSCPLGHFRCMEDIPPERVLQAARALLAP